MSGVVGRGFAFARKIENGKIVVSSDEKEHVFSAVKAYSDAQLPEYQTKCSAGADFFCAEDVVIPSIWSQLFNRVRLNLVKDSAYLDTCGDADAVRKLIQPTFVHTGIKAYMEDDEVLELYNRSSNPKKLGLILANGVGVVDADYFENKDNDGEIMFVFYNVLPFSVTLKAGDRIGQGIFKKFLRPTDSSLRVKDATRVGGVGSTDKGAGC